MPEVVKELKKNQFAFPLGEKNITDVTPLLTVERINPENPDILKYQFTLTFQLLAQYENLTSDTPVKLKEGTFAVLTIDKNQKLLASAFKLSFNAIKESAKVYNLAVVIDGESFPGAKGNHGS